MNKRHYKVIFSRVLNQLVVVSELAKSQGKAQSENVSSEQEKTGLFSTALSLNPIHFSLMLALGLVFLAPSVHAEDMAIRADKSAPNNQQPTVLQTANGFKHQVQVGYHVTSIHNLMWLKKGRFLTTHVKLHKRKWRAGCKVTRILPVVKQKSFLTR